MNDEIFCPVCKFKNSPDTLLCKYCGTSLEDVINRTTTNISTTGPVQIPRVINPKITTFMVPVNALAIFIMDEEEPKVVRDAKEIYLGRFSERPARQFIDLETYGAFKLGVSRFHARIVKVHSTYVIEDINSGNGTWVNDKRIKPKMKTPLKHLDTILLGRLKLVICLPPDSSGKTKPIN